MPYFQRPVVRMVDANVTEAVLGFHAEARRVAESATFGPPQNEQPNNLVDRPPLRYYRFNERSRSVDDGYPKSISVWQGVPDNFKAAFMSKDQGKRRVLMPEIKKSAAS